VKARSGGKQKIYDAFNQYRKNLTLLDSEKDVKTGVLIICIRQMCDQETLGAVVSGKYSSVLGFPTNCHQFGEHIATGFLQLWFQL